MVLPTTKQGEFQRSIERSTAVDPKPVSEHSIELGLIGALYRTHDVVQCCPSSRSVVRAILSHTQSSGTTKSCIRGSRPSSLSPPRDETVSGTARARSRVLVCAPRWRRRGKRKLNVVHGATIKIWLALFAPHSGRAVSRPAQRGGCSTRRPAPARCVVDAEAQPRRPTRAAGSGGM